MIYGHPVQTIDGKTLCDGCIALEEDRVPSAAARQLAVVLADATECQLATVALLRNMRRPGKDNLKRHERIARMLVYHCFDLNVPPRGLKGRTCTRLKRLLDAMATGSKRITTYDAVSLETL